MTRSGGRVRMAALGLLFPGLIQLTNAHIQGRQKATVLDMYPWPVITAAPSADAVARRLVARSVEINSCATACLASAVTKSTDCQIGDYGCECLSENQSVILYGSFDCIESACGAIEANLVLTEAVQLCESYSSNNSGDSSTDDDASSSADGNAVSSVAPPVEASSSAGVIVVSSSSAADNAFSSFLSSFALEPTQTSSSGSTETSSSGSGSYNDHGQLETNSSKKGLSKGAIAGIAVGAAAAVIIAAFLFFWFFVRNRRNNNNLANNGVNNNNTPPPPMSTAAIVPPVQEYSDKPVGLVSTSPHPSSTTNTSPYPNPVSPISSQNTGNTHQYPAGAQWQQYPQGHHEVSGLPPPPPQPQEVHAQPVSTELHGNPYVPGTYEMP